MKVNDDAEFAELDVQLKSGENMENDIVASTRMPSAAIYLYCVEIAFKWKKKSREREDESK